MNTTFTNLLVGWSTGDIYASAKNQEDEIKQGKNYYLSSFNIFSQLAQLGVVISTINKHLPLHPLTKSVEMLCNIAPFLNFPVSLFCAAVKQGSYEKLAERYHQTRFAFIPFPKTLSGRAVSFFSFFAEHTGNVIRVAMITASIGLIILGNAAYGGAVLTAITYQTIDQMGLIPRRISLFMETYMSTVSLIGLLIGGTPTARLISILILPTHIIPSISRYLHQQIDACIRLFLNISGPTLKEIDAPLVRQEEMEFEDITRILESDLDHYEINPAHCVQPTINLDQFTPDRNFAKYLLLFDEIDWRLKYNLIKNKLKDDERFISFLLTQFPSTGEDNLKANIDHYIGILAANERLPPEQYAANWTRQQMVQLVGVLQGKVRVKGSQQDLDEAIKILAKLLPYLSSLNNRCELEDALLKLAIEGGDYCARGIKRAANELYSGILQGVVIRGDPHKTFELNVLQALQDLRFSIIQDTYQTIVRKLNIPHDIAQDIHGFDLYRLDLSLGFFPMTEFERNRLSFPEIATWQVYSKHREHFHTRYKDALEGVISSMEFHFWNYLENMIKSNTNLSEEQQNLLLEKYINQNEGQWDYNKTCQKFHLLLLVRLGILIPIKRK